MQAFSAIGNFFRQAIGLVLPVFAKAGDFRRWNPWVWRILHVLIIAAILVGLWWLNRSSELRNLLQPVPLEYRQFFLPVLFLLLYGLSWFGYWLWRLLGEETAAAEFPDVDTAWTEATQKLDAAGISLADAPLFLVLGRAAAGDDALIEAASVSTDVRAPGGVGQPLRVYANRDAIYVTCSGSSAWGRFAAALAGEGETAGAVTQQQAAAADKTVQFGEQLGLAQELVDEMRELLLVREKRDLTPEESARLRELAEMTKSPAAAKKRVALGAEEAARGTARLAFLCRLIRRDRRPWCPVNGILTVVPWAATENDDNARNAGPILQRDLAAARSALQLRCPVFALLADMETARGFEEFRRGFPPETLKARVGQRLPLVPDLSNVDMTSLYERAVQWIGQAVLPAGIMKFLRYDAAAVDPRKTPAANVHNRNLYLLLREVYTRGPRLARLLSRGLSGEAGGDDAPLFGGCYLAGTGRQASEQAFVPGVFQRLVENQSSVAWTEDAIFEDARYRRWAMMGYAGLAVVAAIGGALFWFGKNPRA